MLEFYQRIPLFTDPIAFSLGSFTIRWYSLGYVFGFITTYIFALLRIKYEYPRFAHCTRRDLEDLINYSIIGVVLGARLGFVIFFDPYYFLYEPHRIFWPFRDGQFVGISGMSYHGGMIGVAVAFFTFHKLRQPKSNIFSYIDLAIPAAALGYSWGRLGNFMNGELYGKITTYPWGMYFFQSTYSVHSNTYVRNPFPYLRHPSQLYQALFEGVFVSFILWSLRNKNWLPVGYVGPFYLILYGFIRFFVEFFREPDDASDGSGAMYLRYVSMGQGLCICMCIAGGLLLRYVYKNSPRITSFVKDST